MPQTFMILCLAELPLKHPKPASTQGASLGLPNKSWTVAQLKAWLEQEGIAYESSDLKADLQRKAGVLDDGDA